MQQIVVGGICKTSDGIIAIGDESLSSSQLDPLGGISTPRQATFIEGQGGLTLFTTIKFSGPRSAPLPTARNTPANTVYSIYDSAFAVSSSNPFSFLLKSTDTYQGGTVNPALSISGGSLSVVCDGVSNWMPVGGGSSGGGGATVGTTVTASGIIVPTAGDYTVPVNVTSGSVTETAPKTTNGQIITVKKIDSSGNPVYLQFNGADEAEGNSIIELVAQWQSITIIGTGVAGATTSWLIR